MPDGKPTSPAPRIPTVAEDLTDADLAEMFAKLSQTPAFGGLSTFNLVRTLAQHPDLLVAFLPLGHHIRRDSTLSDRLREIVTLRAAWVYGSEYAWTKHASHALGLGMPAEEVEATKGRADHPVWSRLEANVLSAVDQLRANTSIDDDTWAALSEGLDWQQQLDLIYTVACYGMTAMVVNSARIASED